MSEDRRAEARKKYISRKKKPKLRELAAELGLTERTLQKWKKEDEWDEKRRKFWERVEKKALTRLSDKRAKELAQMIEANGFLGNGIIKAAKAFDQAMDSAEERLSNKRSGARYMESMAKSIESMARGIESQTNTRMRIAGIMTEQERARLDLLERKMELEERKEKLEREENAGAVTIIMDERTKELAK